MLLKNITMDKFPGGRTWCVPAGRTMPAVRYLKKEGSHYTRMFIVSVLYSYFFLISSKICLMGMWLATSCYAPAPSSAAVQPHEARAVQFSFPFFSLATFSSFKIFGIQSIPRT